MDYVADQVLSPWTDVMVQETEQFIDIEVWGRKYRFAESPLPTEIITQDEKVLASPIRLVGIVNGNKILWERKGISLFNNNKTQATLFGWQANNSLIINITTQIEYDGMMRIDMVIMPQEGSSQKINNLYLEIPLVKDRATLYHYWPGRWGSAENSGAIPEDGMTLPFRPFVWLGWEEGGLSWFTESDKGWQPKDGNRYIEITKQGDEVILRLLMLESEPRRLPLTFTFGLQATPIKPIPKFFYDWHICHGGNYGIEKRPIQEGSSETVLDKMAELGVKTLVFHEHWTPIQNYWETTHKSELRQLITECHKRGIKLLLYFGYEISTLAPEWGKLSDDVLVKTTQGNVTGGYHRQPEQRDYIVCYNSVWQDHFVNGIAKAIERYGFDGVYLDGTIEPWACANERHGCGYRDVEGNLKPTYPIFAVRNLMKRLYVLIHPKGGLVNPHQSTCCVTPTLAFCDSYWDGEQFGGGELADGTLKKLPLSAFRAEFMGKNFGVPCEFLVYEKPPHWTYEHALAFTLLHDVLVRPGGFGKQLELISAIWKAMSDFGVGEAKWYPYWRNQQFITTNSESIKVSFYVKNNEVLLVASNLSQEEIQGQISIESKVLKLENTFTSANDAITGEQIKLENNTLYLSMAPMRAILVKMK
ncbi:MAG: glycoside hydrolase domain-containing protein [Candidatus Poribacteria bacterium]